MVIVRCLRAASGSLADGVLDERTGNWTRRQATGGDRVARNARQASAVFFVGSRIQSSFARPNLAVVICASCVLLGRQQMRP